MPRGYTNDDMNWFTRTIGVASLACSSSTLGMELRWTREPRVSANQYTRETLTVPRVFTVPAWNHPAKYNYTRANPAKYNFPRHINCTARFHNPRVESPREMQQHAS
jgi:hypothetical protein